MPHTFDLTSAHAEITGTVPWDPRGDLTRDEVEVLAGALLSHLEILDSEETLKAAQVVEIIGNSPDLRHYLAVPSFAIVHGFAPDVPGYAATFEVEGFSPDDDRDSGALRQTVLVSDVRVVL